MSLHGSRTWVQLGAGALRNTSMNSPCLRRTFTQSSQRLRYGPVPKFENLSSPELESLLGILREKIIMPAHLSKEQRDLIYRQRHRKSLLTDPVVATLDGEDFVLKPVDRFTDLPRVRLSLYKAANLMKTKEDWDNLPRLLEGLRQGGLKVSSSVINFVTRRAAYSDRQDVILECARQVNATGFRMNNDESVRSTLWSFQLMAVESKFNAESTKKALAWSEQIFELIESPAHIGKGLKEGQLDPRLQPKSIGILLELAAARASKHLGGKDVDGKVAKYAERMSMTSLDFGVPKDGLSSSLWVSEVLPALYGMKVALKILNPGSEVVKKLQVASDSLKKTVDGYLAGIPEVSKAGNVPRSLQMHKVMAESL